MFFKHFYTFLLLVIVSNNLMAGTGPAPPPPSPSPSLPSEQQSILEDCISNGRLLLGLSDQEIDRRCPATSNGLQFTVERTNQSINSNNTSQNNGSGNNNSGQQTLGSLLYGDAAGLNAGSVLNNISVWGSASKSDSEYSLVPIESDTGSAMVGAHTAVSDKGIIGISFGITGTSVDTIYNAGEQELTDYTFAAYGSMAVNDNISVGVNGGYMFREIDQFRNGASVTGGAAPFLPNEVVNGDTESDTWFVSANVDGFWHFDAFIIGLYTGVLYTEEEVDGFTETGATSNATATVGGQAIQTGLFRLGFDIGYTNPGYFEPFVGLEYLNYFEQDEIQVLSSTAVDSDDSEFIWSAGLRLFGDGITGSITYRNNFSREFLDYDSLNFLLSVDL